MNVKKVLIVGGGMSGWIAAAYLDAALNRDGRQLAEIGLLESDAVEAPGIGESMLPNDNQMLAVIGANPAEFMPRVNSTLKQSNKFVNWLQKEGEYFHHPFTRHEPAPVDLQGEQWLMSDRSIPYCETVTPQPVLCDIGLSPLPLNSQEYGSRLNFSYHMDGPAMLAWLRDLAISRGVEHFDEICGEVEIADNGDIEAVVTSGGNRIAADLFIDCTGFAGELIGQQLGEDWVDCSKWLLCDRALSLAVPYDVHYPGTVNPYTTATALSAGWVEEIPLLDRRSLRYFFAGEFSSEEQAELELKRTEGVHANALESRIDYFRVGHRRRSWVNNCVAIGNSSGYVEPLDSTGMYLNNFAAILLADHFPFGRDMRASAYRYNRIMLNRYYEILDLVNAHYSLSRRKDSAFWQQAASAECMNPRLREKLDYWRMKPPSSHDFEDQNFSLRAEPHQGTGDAGVDNRPPVDTGGLWGLGSYEFILYGMDFLSQECDEWFGKSRPPTSVPAGILRNLQAAPRIFPPHEVWLQQLAGMKSYGHRSKQGIQ